MKDKAEKNPIEDEDVLDDAAQDDTVPLEKYAISSFGVDFDVEGLVRRLRKEDVFVPYFQRSYVWLQPEASQFIESLLLGLPVPGVFLAKEGETQRMLIIDGQQRLKTLQFFYDGFFRPDQTAGSKKVFKLINVQPQLEGKEYKTLEEEDRRRLDNAVIHATIIKQESPDEDEDTSLFYIFGRLNSTGRKLNAQEIRSALYHGPFVEMVQRLNTNKHWRLIYGKESERIKDQELILRFIALYFDGEKYVKPMEDFLNRFCKRHQNDPGKFLEECTKLFDQTISIVHAALGERTFRPVRGINAAVFDSIMVGLAKRFAKGKLQNHDALRQAYNNLTSDKVFIDVTSKSTSNEASVETRLRLAKEAFDQVP
jgi:hypothetical protein